MKQIIRMLISRKTKHERDEKAKRRAIIFRQMRISGMTQKRIGQLNGVCTDTAKRLSDKGHRLNMRKMLRSLESLGIKIAFPYYYDVTARDLYARQRFQEIP
jgi:hypothetical protein